MTRTVNEVEEIVNSFGYILLSEYSGKNKKRTEKVFKESKYRDRIKKKFAKKNGTYIEIDLRKIKTTEQAIGYVEDIISKL